MPLKVLVHTACILIAMALSTVVVKKAKKPNWEPRAIRALVMGLQDHDHVIRTKYGKAVTKCEKIKAWGDIERRVNSVSNVERTLEEVKKKWSDLSSQVKKKEAMRRADARKTGGGAPMEELTEIEIKVIALLGDTAIEGVSTGIDTMQEDSHGGEPAVGETGLSTPSEPEPSTSSQDFEALLNPATRCETSAVQVIRNSQKEGPARKVSPTQLDRLEELEKQRLAVERERLEIEKARFTLEQHRFNLAVAQSGITQWEDLASLLLQN